MSNEEEKKTPPNPQQPGETKVNAPSVSGSKDEIGNLRNQLQEIDHAFRDAPTPWINGTAIGYLSNIHKQPGIFILVDPSAPECERAGIQERVGAKARMLRVSRFIGLQTSSPTTPGNSVGTYAPFRYNLPPVNAGTLGAQVVVNGQEYILSSNHVLAHNGRARKGTPITVPGAIDELTAGPVVAKRSYFVPLQFSAEPLSWPSQGPPNFADCALALESQPRPAGSATGVLPSITSLTSADLVTLSQATVKKRGRATGETTSRVRLFDLRGYIGFTFGTCYFEGMVGTYDDDRAIFAAPGDSGSVAVVDQSAPGQFRGQAVGLITARAYVFDNSDNFIGYIIAMCPMATVADELARVMSPVQGRNLTKGDFEFFA